MPSSVVINASALLTGAIACLLLPRLLPWVFLALLLCLAMALWQRSARWRWLCAMTIGFAWAGLHAASTLVQQLPATLELQTAEISGQVIDLPLHEVRRTQFLFRVDKDDRQPQALRGKRLRLAWYDDRHANVETLSEISPRYKLKSGSRWRMAVKLRAPRGLRNPGGFDSERYALQQRIAATGYLRHPETARQLVAPVGMDAWREQMSRRIETKVARASSRFIRALALGDTRGLSDTDWETLRATGLTHLIAISGFHVGLVAGFFALFANGIWRAFPVFARRIPRPQATAIAALLGALGYAAAAGLALPTVRTVLMIAVAMMALQLRRAQNAADAIALAAIAVLLVDPLAILGAGFWLSFAGVAWLLWCLPHVAQVRSAWTVTRTFVSAQLVATLGLLPLSAMLFGQASLAGPFANLFAIPWWSFVVVPLSLLGTAAEAIHADWGVFFLACRCPGI